MSELCSHPAWVHAEPASRPPRAVLALGIYGDARMRWAGPLVCAGCGALWPGEPMAEALSRSRRAIEERSRLADRNARHRSVA